MKGGLSKPKNSLQCCKSFEANENEKYKQGERWEEEVYRAGGSVLSKDFVWVNN